MHCKTQGEKQTRFALIETFRPSSNWQLWL